MNDPHQNFENLFGENNNYHKLGNAYIQYDITMRKVVKSNFNDEARKIIKIALADTFKEARLAATGWSDLEHNKYFGKLSTILRPIASKDEDLWSRFDKINEKNIDITSLKHKLNNNHDIDA